MKGEGFIFNIIFIHEKWIWGPPATRDLFGGSLGPSWIISFEHIFECNLVPTPGSAVGTTLEPQMGIKNGQYDGQHGHIEGPKGPNGGQNGKLEAQNAKR